MPPYSRQIFALALPAKQLGQQGGGDVHVLTPGCRHPRLVCSRFKMLNLLLRLQVLLRVRLLRLVLRELL
jgi:hypothetical protein